MNPKPLLDEFSEALSQDERILSRRERELLTSLIQSAQSGSALRPEVAEAVRETIARAVGETLTRRAFGLLGNEVLERLQDGQATARPRLWYDVKSGPGGTPRPPGPAPVPPGSAPQPMPDGVPRPTSPGPNVPPASPSGSTTRTVHAEVRTVTSSAAVEVSKADSVAVLERPEFLKARCLVLNEFLAPAELDELLQYTLAREAEFQISEVIAPGVNASATDYDTRRSRVLMDLGKHQAVIVNRLQSCLPEVLRKLEIEPFTARKVEAQITASNDLDFFHLHSDNMHEDVASRELTFVYFFHREPKEFCGGELRVYDSRLENGFYVSAGRHEAIVPEQNQIVFFASSQVHEITPVKCPSREFAHSRFTVNGWLHR